MSFGKYPLMKANDRELRYCTIRVFVNAVYRVQFLYIACSLCCIDHSIITDVDPNRESKYLTRMHTHVTSCLHLVVRLDKKF